jgi:U3 small nucleolar RNA-associated protein 11
MSMRQVRNALSSQRRQHRERSQPKARQKMGLLEKKKDYKQRAVDWHRKEDRIAALKEKASMRNPDEFYFAMHNARTKDGVHTIKRVGKQYTAAALKAMNGQDKAYMTMQLEKEKRRIDRMQNELHDLEAPAENKHVIFCDDQKKIDTFSAAEYFDTAPELAERTHNRPTMAQLRAAPVMGARMSTLTNGELNDKQSLRATKKALAKLEKQKNAKYRELDARVSRKRKMEEMVGQLAQQRTLMGKGRKKKMTTVDKFGDVDESKTYYKWKLERKK